MTCAQSYFPRLTSLGVDSHNALCFACGFRGSCRALRVSSSLRRGPGNSSPGGRTLSEQRGDGIQDATGGAGEEKRQIIASGREVWAALESAFMATAKEIHVGRAPDFVAGMD